MKESRLQYLFLETRVCYFEGRQKQTLNYDVWKYSGIGTDAVNGTHMPFGSETAENVKSNYFCTHTLVMKTRKLQLGKR